MTATALQDQVAAAYDDMSEELAVLGEQQALVGADTLAHECREFAYVAWRAARAEHLDPEVHELRPCACRECQRYALVADKSAPAVESLA